MISVARVAERPPLAIKFPMSMLVAAQRTTVFGYHHAGILAQHGDITSSNSISK
jgi:hypothetical protein